MKRLAHILFASGFLLLLTAGTAHANNGPYIGIIFVILFMGIPGLLLLGAILYFLPIKRSTAAYILLLAVLLFSLKVYDWTEKSVKHHETWQWYGARANMEMITGALSSYAPIYEAPPYPVGELDYQQLTELLPSVYNFPPSPDDAYFFNFHYGSINGDTYRIEVDVHTRRPTWIWATPEGIGPDEPEPRP